MAFVSKISLLIIIFVSTSFINNNQQVQEYTLLADITGYIGVGGKIDGLINPDLEIKIGNKVVINIINHNHMPHDILFEKHQQKSKMLYKKNEQDRIEFIVTSEDTYICSLPGHRGAGMEGRLMTKGVSPPNSSVSVFKDPLDIPSSSESTSNPTYNIIAIETTALIDRNNTYNFWTFNGTVPGPMLRAKKNDLITINFENDSKSLMPHSIDFHAFEIPHGGANILDARPGEKKQLKIKGTKSGLYVYHCATTHIATHMGKGMYGMALIEPENGLNPVDRELYIMQGEYYTKPSDSIINTLENDYSRLLDERPTHVVMNGTNIKNKDIEINKGETIRIFFGVGGPNLSSSVHIIGEIFDKVYPHGSFANPYLKNIQTVLVPPGGATILEVTFDEYGIYPLVDHALSRMDKGAFIKIIVK